MASLGLDRLFAFVSHCHGALDRARLYVEQVSHANDVRRATETLGADTLSRSFDPDWSDLSQGNSFWLMIYHRPQSGPRELIGIIGARLDTVAGGEFTSLLTRRMNRLYGHADTPAITDSTPPPVFAEMSGRVVAISDLFISPEFRGNDRINLRALLLLMIAYARTEWDFDWLYAFVSEDHAAQGYLATYCFANTYPAALLWAVPPNDRADTDVFGSLSRADFLYLVDLVTRRPRLLQFK